MQQHATQVCACFDNTLEHMSSFLTNKLLRHDTVCPEHVHGKDSQHLFVSFFHSVGSGLSGL